MKNIQLFEEFINEGVKVSPGDAKFFKKLTEDEIDRLINIGFCQPKFYKPTTWRKASRVMEYLITKGLVIPYDYGRGKGKYSMSNDDHSIDDISKEALIFIKSDFGL